MHGQSFQLPIGNPEQQLTHCLRIINAQREELLPVRKIINLLRLQKSHADKSANHWKEKCQQAEEDIRKLKEEKKRLKKENNKLKEEIEKLAKTNNRYRVSLFDHGNFKHPDEQAKKPKGGQTGHANTNKDRERDYASFKKERIYAGICGGCGKHLTRANSVKEKTLIDIEINPQLVQLIIRSERQWCGTCKKEMRAVHPQSLPFTEYGINTFMVVLYLRFKGKQSFGTISCTLNNLFGLPITKSGVGTILFQAKEYLQGKYEELKQAIRNGEIMYNDETGWSVRGKSAWMWIMTTPDKKQADGKLEAGLTVYVAAESRGKGIFEEMYGNSNATSMHDGYAGYESITGKEKTAYCWSHVLRFAYEETVKLPPKHPACLIRDRLVDLYQNIRAHPDSIKKQKEATLLLELDGILSIQSKDKTVNNILHRVSTQKEGLILALLITPDGTNNLGEREFRELVNSRHISYGSDTYKGMEATAVLFSVVKTIARDKNKPFLPTLKSYLGKGIQKDHPQYKHTPVFAA